MRMDRDKVCRNAVDRAYYDFAVQIVAQAVRDLKTARKRLKRLARKKEPLDAMAIRTVLHEGGRHTLLRKT